MDAIMNSWIWHCFESKPADGMPVTHVKIPPQQICDCIGIEAGSCEDVVPQETAPVAERSYLCGDSICLSYLAASR